MSVALFDAGQRLRAAALGRPVARASYAPVLKPTDPIAVTVRGSGHRWVVHGVDVGPAGVLQLASLVAGGDTLPGLEVFAHDDAEAWTAFAERMMTPGSSWDWRRRDSRREAALGLASRCDATEFYESLRLAD